MSSITSAVPFGLCVYHADLKLKHTKENTWAEHSTTKEHVIRRQKPGFSHQFCLEMPKTLVCVRLTIFTLQLLLQTQLGGGVK